jgi:hypothetical protein
MQYDHNSKVLAGTLILSFPGLKIGDQTLQPFSAPFVRENVETTAIDATLQEVMDAFDPETNPLAQTEAQKAIVAQHKEMARKQLEAQQAQLQAELDKLK